MIEKIKIDNSLQRTFMQTERGLKSMRMFFSGTIYERTMIHHWLIVCAMIALFLVSFVPSSAFADDEGEGSQSMLDQCTTGSFFDFDENTTSQAQEMLVDIATEIKGSIDGARDKLYTAFTSNSGYNKAIGAAFALMIIIYAVTVMTGMTNLTLQSGVLRLAKIGAVAFIVTSDSKGDILQYITDFFDLGGDCLIYGFHMLAMTGAWSDACGEPATAFLVLDDIIRIVFSPRMFVTILGCLGTPPFGLVVGVALGWAVISVFTAVLRALQIYCVAMVIKAVLYGMTPVFLPMILFERTKAMFSAWIYQLISFTLQPVLMFAFISFFATMVLSAAQDLLPKDDVHFCYVRSNLQAATPNDTHAWKAACCDGAGTCTPYEGTWTWEGGIECEDGPIFPVNHVKLLTFLLLVHIMRQLCEVAVSLASEISQGSLTVMQNNPMNAFFGGGGAASASTSQNNLTRNYSTRSPTPSR